MNINFVITLFSIIAVAIGSANIANRDQDEKPGWRSVFFVVVNLLLLIARVIDGRAF